jgi:hypothetical protein
MFVEAGVQQLRSDDLQRFDSASVHQISVTMRLFFKACRHLNL